MTIFGNSPLEIIATLCSLGGVILIARQKQLGWLLGMFWAAISAWLAWTQWHLVSDAILYASYLPIQIYCWLSWQKAAGVEELRPSFLKNKTRWMLCAAILLTIVLWGFAISQLSASFAWIPAPALLWRDAASTVLNYFAQFLQAKKRMENWALWIVVNLLGIHIYWIKDVPIYALQYAIFLCLGVYGFLTWQRSMRTNSEKL
jgi:nicotinamide mononucleotide transporter